MANVTRIGPDGPGLVWSGLHCGVGGAVHKSSSSMQRHPADPHEICNAEEMHIRSGNGKWGWEMGIEIRE
jgi:hypothetical protein